MDTITLLQDIVKNTKRVFYEKEYLNQSLSAVNGYKDYVDIDTEGAGVISIQLNNKGTSEKVTVAVYTAIGSLAYTSSAVAVANFNTTLRNDAIYVDCYFDKIKVVVTNTDLTNSTTFDIAIKVFAK